jgi:hypothetical protein
MASERLEAPKIGAWIGKDGGSATFALGKIEKAQKHQIRENFD